MNLQVSDYHTIYTSAFASHPLGVSLVGRIKKCSSPPIKTRVATGGSTGSEQPSASDTGPLIPCLTNILCV